LTVILNPQLSMIRGADARGSSPGSGRGDGTPAWSVPGVDAHAASAIATAARDAASTARREPGERGERYNGEPPRSWVGARVQRDNDRPNSSDLDLPLHIRRQRNAPATVRGAPTNLLFRAPPPSYSQFLRRFDSVSEHRKVARPRPTTVVIAASTRTTSNGDKQPMLDKHEQFARDAAADGAQIICFQELFYGPYFGITQDKKYYSFAEPVDGPIVTRFAALAKELGMVTILPVYEEEMAGVYYNTTVVVDADGTVLGKYRKHHLPHLDRFWEKFYFRPGNLGYPVFETAVGKVGTYICYDRHFPEGWRELGLGGADMVFNPNATKPGLSNRLWEVEGPAAAVANGYFVLQPNRVGREDNEYGDLAVDFYGTSQIIDPRGNFVGERGSGSDEEILVRDLDMAMVQQMRDDWQFFRDRRPDSYTRIAQP